MDAEKSERVRSVEGKKVLKGEETRDGGSARKVKREWR